MTTNVTEAMPLILAAGARDDEGTVGRSVGLPGVLYCTSLCVEWPQTLAARLELTVVLGRHTTAITACVLASSPREQHHRVFVADAERFEASLLCTAVSPRRRRFTSTCCICVVKTLSIEWFW